MIYGERKTCDREMTDFEKRLCDKCKKDDIDEHHVHPKYMDNKGGYINEKYNFPSRVFLCVECHKKLHSIIKEILKEYSNKKDYNSEYKLWQYVNDNDKEIIISKVIGKTISFIKEGEKDGNTKTTTN